VGFALTRQDYALGRNNPFDKPGLIPIPQCTISVGEATNVERRKTVKDTLMTSKILGLLTAALILGSASIASAATVHSSRAAAGTRAAESFQSNWNVGY
jgi:hypothetical protein